MAPDSVPSGTVHTTLKRKRSDPDHQQITHKRHLVRKEQKRLEIEFHEKLTKLRNGHKKQLEDLEAEKERRLQDLELQEDDIDFEESLLMSANTETSCSVSKVKTEVITISDDEEEVIKTEELTVETRPSRIVCLKYRLGYTRTSLNRHTSVLPTIGIRDLPPASITIPEKCSRSRNRKNADADDGEYIEPEDDKTILDKIEQKIKIRSEKSVMSKSSTVSAPKHSQVIKTNSVIQMNSSSNNTIRKYFQPTTNTASLDTATTAKLPIQSIIQTPATLIASVPKLIPTIEGIRTTRSKLAIHGVNTTQYEPCTKSECHELKNLFISKLKSEIIPSLHGRLARSTRDTFLSEVRHYQGKPSQFFARISDLASTWGKIHPLCCRGNAATVPSTTSMMMSRSVVTIADVDGQGQGQLRTASGIRCWMVVVVSFLTNKKREFWKCMTQCERLGLNHQERMSWIENWNDDAEDEDEEDGEEGV